ncbi:hypothetical protein M2349_000319 [Caldanaerobacter subterraneus subsp. tengcongensis MB4]|uniref:Uncharacterized protein n=1 Tax=Caldanaerobacter subterraneus subsp. tengcongensis (strain DSM 15242 / JCM 11007 / NBRC 100824 / MB4) TaxID=273068 RepID=Q8R8F3_CALS4|nr:hypothetical protein [Caldanaerobacter subterraneus]AAM25225.1 hypothetical protein TTE2051 [Caldanaerobacter subterraneus subsp. tengcongensis MB4]MCS3915178.1 hypothetical protein [Caldanaerobacter subterraneus subsp. tengcongensis MB4]
MNKWLVDDWVNECALKPIKYFTPTAIEKDTGISLEEVFERLMELVNDNKLELYWRIVCPVCFRQLYIYKSTDRIPRYIDCVECGKQQVTEDMIFPLFSISNEYREHIKSLKKTFNTLVYARLLQCSKTNQS